MILHFGKYSGCDIRDVPTDYLEWVIENTQKTVDACKEELERRYLIEEADQSWTERVITAGYRELSKRHHPDAGGDTADMQKLNAAVEFLREVVR